MQRRPLGPSAARVVTFVREFIAEHGYSPSYAEIAEGCGLRSSTSAAGAVHRLVERGVLTRSVATARSVRVVEGA